MLQKTPAGLASSSAIYVSSSILSAAIPFLLLPVLTRYLTTAEYGEVAMFQTVLTALGAVTGLSVNGAAGRRYYDADLTRKELKLFIGSCFQILAISTIGVWFVLAVFQDRLSEWIGLQGRWIFIAGCSAALNFVVLMRLGQWQVSRQAWNYGAMQVAQSSANVLLSLVLVVGCAQGASGRIWAQVTTALLFAGLALVSLHRDDLLGFAWRPRYLEEALGFGIPLVPHSVGLLFLSLFDRFVINAELGLTEVAVYMVAAQLVAPIGLVLDAANRAYVPWLYERLKRDRGGEKEELVRLTYMSFILMLTAAGTFFMIGPFVVGLVAGERYSRAGEVIGWLALGQALVGMYQVVTGYIFFSKKTGLLSLVTIGSGSLNLVLLWLFVAQWGLVGAAIASTSAMGVRFILTWCVAQRRHPMPWSKIKLIA